MPEEPRKDWDLIVRYSVPSVKRPLVVTVLIVSFSKLNEVFLGHILNVVNTKMHFLSGLSALTRCTPPELPISSLGHTESRNVVLLLLCIGCGNAQSWHETASRECRGLHGMTGRCSSYSDSSLNFSLHLDVVTHVFIPAFIDQTICLSC